MNIYAAWTVTGPVMASAAAATRVFMSFLLLRPFYPLPGAIEAAAQRAVADLRSAPSREPVGVAGELHVRGGGVWAAPR